jgi:hypothetical protein
VVEEYEWRNMLLPWLQEESLNLGAAHGAAWIVNTHVSPGAAELATP